MPAAAAENSTMPANDHFQAKDHVMRIYIS
jgi:hypothetical protein